MVRSSWHSSGYQNGTDSVVLMTSLSSWGMGWLVPGDTTSSRQGELWVSRPLQCLLSGPYFLSEQRAFEITISILAFHFLSTVFVFLRQYLEMLVISLCRWQGLGLFFFFREHASERRVMGTICPCIGLWDRRATVKWSSQSPVSAVRSLSREIRDKNKMRAEWDLVRIFSWVSASEKATTDRDSSRAASAGSF